MYRFILALLLSIAAMNTSQARDDFHTPDHGDPEREALLATAQASARNALGQPVHFSVETIRVGGDWGFLYAHMQRDDGAAIDYTGTAFATAAKEGGMSQDYAALLQRVDGRWHVRSEAIGPTDVVWQAWPQQYGAPPALFEN